MILNIFVILTVWFLAIVYHQSLYVIFPILGIFYFLYFDFSFKINRVTKPFLVLFLSVLFIFSIQLFTLPELAQFNFNGIGRYFGYLTGALFVSGFNSKTIEYTLFGIIIFILIQFPFEIVSLINGVRFQGIFEHSNHYAYFLNVILFYLLFNNTRSNLNSLSVILVVISILGTLSSGGLLTATSIMFGKLLYKKKWVLIYFILGIVLVALLSSLFYLSSSRFQEQVEGLANIDFDYIVERAIQKNGGGNASIIWRFIYWISIILEFNQESLSINLFGLGVDSMTMGNYVYPFMVTDPHNDYLKILVELGLVGFVLFLFFQKTLFYMNHKSYSFLSLLILPFFFGNVLVNFPFIFTLIIVLSYFYSNSISTKNRKKYVKI